jgi:protein involved in polysaccharide export with SLBB domain
MFRQSFARVASPLVVSMLLIAVVMVAAGPQEKEKARPPAPRVEKPKQPPIGQPGQPAVVVGSRAQARRVIDKMLDSYDLKPRPLPAIPDDPPPHEGAMIRLPHIVEPPDLILVEVLEAAAGRPISGERLVRPDDTIDLGFYGELHVSGLTHQQIEIAVIKHLRKYLGDEILGLMVSIFDQEAEQPAAKDPFAPPQPAIPDLPEGEGNPFKDPEKPRASFDRRDSSARRRVVRRGSRSPVAVRSVRARSTRVASQDRDAPAVEQNPLKIESSSKGRVTITIDIEGGRPLPSPLPQPVEPAPPPVSEDEGPWRIVPPEENDRVFVDVTAYNSKNFYVLGDVLVPGRMPWTGNETVLDAMQFAQGLIPTAEPNDIRLVRPGRGGKPAKVYKVDLAAIQEQGNAQLNYQVFPGDRLIVGRNEVVKKSVEIDRLNTPLQAITSSIQQDANLLKSLGVVSAGPEGDEALKHLVDFWAKELSRTGDLKLDEQELRELLRHELKPAAPQSPPAPKPK